MARGIDAIIDKNTIYNIRKHIGITYDYISGKTKCKISQIQIWEDSSNDIYPTINQAKKIAKCYHIPFAGLYMNFNNININHLHKPKYFNMRTMPSTQNIDDSELNIAIVDLLNSRETLIDIKKELNEEIKPFNIFINTNDIKEFASSLRERFNIDIKKQYQLKSTRKLYLYIRNEIEKEDILIQNFSGVRPETIRGLALYNNVLPVIGINAEDRYPAKTFSIIHELVHICKRDSTVCNDMSDSFSAKSEEVFCNAVAGEFLVPESEIENIISNNNYEELDIDTISEISKRFSVSNEVIVRRLYDMNIINNQKYFILTEALNEKYRLEKESQKSNTEKNMYRRSIPREVIDKNSSILCRALFYSYCDDIINKQDYARYLNINQKHVEKILTEVSKWED